MRKWAYVVCALVLLIFVSTTVVSPTAQSADPDRKPQGPIPDNPWTTLNTLNPAADVDGPCADPYTSGGNNVAAVWVLVNVDLAAYANQAVSIRWLFDTEDELYNKFEGWFVDDISIGPLGSKSIGTFTNGADSQRNKMFTGGNFGTEMRLPAPLKPRLIQNPPTIAKTCATSASFSLP